MYFSPASISIHRAKPRLEKQEPFQLMHGKKSPFFIKSIFSPIEKMKTSLMRRFSHLTYKNSEFSYDKVGLLVRLSPKDGSVLKLFPVKLRELIIRISHYPSMEGHPGGRKIYETLLRSFYWPHMAKLGKSYCGKFPFLSKLSLKHNSPEALEAIPTKNSSVNYFH